MLSLFKRPKAGNAPVLLAVADAIEAACRADARPPVGFNMAIFNSEAFSGYKDMTGHRCQTVACIEGWVCNLGYDGQLGLTEEQEKALFFPPGWDTGGITPAQAVDTLRRLAKTGRVEWRL